MLRALDVYWCVYCEFGPAKHTDFDAHMESAHPGWESGALQPKEWPHSRYHPEFKSDCRECLQLENATLQQQLREVKESKDATIKVWHDEADRLANEHANFVKWADAQLEADKHAIDRLANENARLKADPHDQYYPHKPGCARFSLPACHCREAKK